MAEKEKITYKDCIDAMIHEKSDYKCEVEAFVDINESGQLIAGAMLDDKKIYFNSKYNGDRLVDIWASSQDISNYRTIAVVFGMANTDYIRALRNKNEEMLIIVYEPSIELIEYLYTNGYLQDLIDDSRIVFAIDEQKNNTIYGCMLRVLEFETVKYLRYFISPNYGRVYLDEVEFVKNTLEHSIASVYMNRNSVMEMKDEITENISKNILDCVEQYNITNLKIKFDEIDKTNIPAIVVAAGPSLDKNIKELKRVKGKAFIICVDTALNTLAEIDVIPDISVTIDPHKPVSLFENPKMKKVPMVFNLSSNNMLLEVLEGKRFYSRGDDALLDVFEKRFNKKNVVLETGGSVSNNAFSLAQKLGFTTIICVGLDLAYPNDKEHTELAYGEAINNTIDETDTKYFYVEDINGEMIRTEGNMDSYRKWFEKTVLVYNENRYIDATEGGAKIEGMEIMTLSDAISETCISERIIDFSQYIENVDEQYTAEEKKEIYAYIANLDAEMNRIESKIRSGIQSYEKLDEYNRKQSYSGKGFEKAFSKISEINKWMATDPEVKFLTMYSAEKEYEVRGQIFEEKENTFEELKFVCKNGIEMLNSLLKSIERFKQDMQNNISVAKEKIEELC